MSLILISSFLPKKEDNISNSNEKILSDISNNNEDTTKYCDNLNSKLEKILSSIDGVGECHVCVTTNGTSQYSYAKNKDESTWNEKQEVEQKYVILKKENNEIPIIESIYNPEINGVVIVCEGGNSNVVKEKVYKAVSALLNIKTDKIYVDKLK
ncbi:MAG: hypothetical protein IJZ64_05955 [Ruminococcus sp.]|nr:hypothetical protein [Ruminococcus sp.]